MSNGSWTPEKFEPFRLAGLGPAELSSLLRVSRVTASLWLNGRHRPHHLLEDRVEQLLRAVQDALAAGELPLSRDIPRRERYWHLRRVLEPRLELTA